jgi:N-acetylglutamate synthase-like GNAT family acetyltransferase
MRTVSVAIDDAVSYQRRGGTVDDALAHEFVHYLQATYRKEILKVDLSELEAVAIQPWYRREYMGPELLASADMLPS